MRPRGPAQAADAAACFTTQSAVTQLFEHPPRPGSPRRQIPDLTTKPPLPRPPKPPQTARPRPSAAERAEAAKVEAARREAAEAESKGMESIVPTLPQAETEVHGLVRVRVRVRLGLGLGLAGGDSGALPRR